MEGQFIGLDVGGTKIASATLQDGKLTTRNLLPVRFVGGVRPGTGNGPAEAA